MLVQYLTDLKGQFGGFTECYLVINGSRYPFLAHLHTPSPMLESEQIGLFAKCGVSFTPDFLETLTQAEKYRMLAQILKRQELDRKTAQGQEAPATPSLGNL